MQAVMGKMMVNLKLNVIKTSLYYEVEMIYQLHDMLLLGI